VFVCRFVISRKLEAEERARSNAFKERMQKSTAISTNYERATGTQLKQKTAESNAQILRAMADKDRLDEEKERKKVEGRKNESRRDADYNLKMMDAKKRLAEKEKLESLEIRLRLEKDAQDAKRQELEVAEQRKQRLLADKEILDQQMLSRLENKRRDKATFSDDDDRKNKVTVKVLL
jgi:zinc finger CCCH domain-containing protein 13